MSADEGELIGGSVSNELSAQRTAMSFERSALSTHRTLQSTMRTSLSLTGFGFTIFSFFNTLATQFLEGRIPQDAARTVGFAMVVLGVTILGLGIMDHYRGMQSLRGRKKRLVELGIQRSELPLTMASSMGIAITQMVIALGVLIYVTWATFAGGAAS